MLLFKVQNRKKFIFIQCLFLGIIFGACPRQASFNPGNANHLYNNANALS
jgi:hypothetical protein